MEKHEHTREVTWIAEIHKNKQMREKMRETEEDLLHHKSTVLFGLQDTVDKQELKILKQEEEAKALTAVEAQLIQPGEVDCKIFF